MPRGDATFLFASAVLAPFALLYLVHSLTPEIQPDAATYHLGLAAEWARNGRLASRIGFYDLLPLGMETIFFPAVLAGGFSAAKLVHLFLLGATVPLMTRIGAQLGLDRTAALAAAGIYALAPVTGISGTAAYNDAALVFFSLAAFALLLEDARTPSGTLLFHAGLAAGFCYAVKITGLLVPAALILWLLFRKRWHRAALAAAASSLSLAPWMLRNLLLTGNPLAPLANRLFPNDAFHAFNEAALASYLSDYGLHWSRIPWALAVDGTSLQGLFGPVIFLLPVALLALRKPAGSALLAAAFVLLLPWTRNVGARFLMPAFALLALALVLALPRRAAPLLLAVHALFCWPAMLDRYAGKAAWRLHGFPWQAALRIEPEAHYLAAHLGEYRFTRLAAARLPDNEPLLDLCALPFAYLNTVPTGPLSSAQFDNIVQALNSSDGASPDRQYPLRCRFPLRFVRAVRLRLAEPFPAPWSITEVEFHRRGAVIPVSPRWLLSASPEPGDAWLAIDRNRATRWSTWEHGRPGMEWQVTFDRPAPIDGAMLTLPNFPRLHLGTLEAQGLDRNWRNINSSCQIGTPARVFHRRAAMRFVKQQGFHWIAARIGGGGHGATAESLAALSQAWGVEIVLREGDLALFRIR
jgi:hypothetical protein